MKIDNVFDKHQYRIAVDTIKYPLKSLLGGMDSNEAEKILKDKFNVSQCEIDKMKGVKK